MRSRVVALTVATVGAMILATGLWLLLGLAWALIGFGGFVVVEAMVLVEYPDRQPVPRATPFTPPTPRA